LNVLGHAVFQIDDLTGSDLAWERQEVITLDRTADGHGWFIDPTPGNDSAFASNAVKSPARAMSICSRSSPMRWVTCWAMARTTVMG
jgi:hypothetical protein